MGVFETIGQWITNTMSLFFESTLNGMLTVFSDVFIWFANDTTMIMGMPIIVKTLALAKIVAVYILMLKLVYDLLMTYSLGVMGDAESGNPLTVIRDGAFALILIFNVDFIIREIYRFGINLVGDVIYANNLTFDTFGASIQAEMQNGIAEYNAVMSGGITMIVVIFIILVVLLLVIIVQMAIRKAELVYYQLIAPFLAINVASANKDIWGILIKSVVVLSLSQVIQLVLILMVFQTLTSFDILVGTFYAIGFAWVALATPNALKQFTHSSGVGSAITGLGRMKMQSVMMKGRK